MQRSRDVGKRHSGFRGLLVVCIVILVFTILYQIISHASYRPNTQKPLQNTAALLKNDATIAVTEKKIPLLTEIDNLKNNSTSRKKVAYAITVTKDG
jgi:hypothetical protein